MAYAQTRAECEEIRDRYVAELRLPDPAETVVRDWDQFTTFYRYPMEHWIHLGTSNAIESVFGGVRIRTDAARRLRRRGNAVCLMLKIVGTPEREPEESQLRS